MATEPRGLRAALERPPHQWPYDEADDCGRDDKDRLGHLIAPQNTEANERYERRWHVVDGAECDDDHGAAQRPGCRRGGALNERLQLGVVAVSREPRRRDDREDIDREKDSDGSRDRP